LLLKSKIGQQFGALVMFEVVRGTWAKLLDIPIDEKSVQVFKCPNEGDRVRIKMMSIDVECGFINFK
jgi:hypothetical protein